MSRGSHGMTESPEYLAWSNMRARCHYPRDKKFANYGGRGIRVCDRWLKAFANFFADMGPRPTPGHSLDRIDNDGNYEPGNCRWATREVQANNKSTSRRISFRGREQTVAQWSAELGFSPELVHSRLNNGWPVEAALSLPPNAIWHRPLAVVAFSAAPSANTTGRRQLLDAFNNGVISQTELARKLGIKQSA